MKTDADLATSAEPFPVRVVYKPEPDPRHPWKLWNLERRGFVRRTNRTPHAFPQEKSARSFAKQTSGLYLAGEWGYADRA